MSPATRMVLTSIDELLAGATSRESFNPGDGLSDVPMQRVTIDGARYVAKWIGPEIDWVMRAVGDTLPVSRVEQLWTSGVFDRLPAEIDHTLVAIAHEGDTTVLLMRDVGEHFLPEGDVEIPLTDHRRFLDHMAALHVAFWGFTDPGAALSTVAQRYRALSPLTAAAEQARGSLAGIPSHLPAAWDALVSAAGDLGPGIRAIPEQPAAFESAMQQLPQTLVHGDWKAGNLGKLPDSRTVLVDWAWPGAAPCTVDLAWYLAVNCSRLPESKESTIEVYRNALESRGVTTEPWWDRALALGLLGGLLQLGWSKVDEPDELAWWLNQSREPLTSLTSLTSLA